MKNVLIDNYTVPASGTIKVLIVATLRLWIQVTSSMEKEEQLEGSYA